MNQKSSFLDRKVETRMGSLGEMQRYCLDLDRDTKGNKESFYRYVSNERKTVENMISLWKEMRDQVT